MSSISTRVIHLFAALALLASAAQASPIAFVPNGDNNAGSVKCELALKSLGSLQLKNGSAVISGRVITVKSASEYIEAPRTVLVGSVLRTEANLTSEPPSITGLALFLMGDWAGQIDDQRSLDTVFRKDGHLEGRIMGMEGETISLQLANGKQEKIPLSSILYIRSARVFVFKISLKSKQPLQKDTEFQADASEASFRPTETARTLSGSIIPQSQKGDEDAIGLPLTPPGMGGRPLVPGLPSYPSMPGMGGLTGIDTMGGAGSFPQMGGAGMPGSTGGPRSAIDDPRGNSFDNGEDAARFSTIKTKYGTQKMSIPPGILD